MHKTYGYVGPPEIAARAPRAPQGTVIRSADDVRTWAHNAGVRSGSIIATYVIGSQGELRLVDRRSEHVTCTGGGMVLAAGEVTFRIEAGEVTVEEITNQSTGYCPEPESWPAVSAALATTRIHAPDDYTTKFQFRRCPRCRQINIVKDDLWECALCGEALPTVWNFSARESS